MLVTDGTINSVGEGVKPGSVFIGVDCCPVQPEKNKTNITRM